MRLSTIIICAFAIGTSLAMLGCGHRLVAHNGENTIAVYLDENTFLKLSKLKNQGGPLGGALAGLSEGYTSKQVDNNTPVKIISKDDNGAQVEILDGAYKGMHGFVPADNIR